MDRIEFWDWMDLVQILAFSSSEPLQARMFYAEWWLAMAYHLEAEIVSSSASP